MCGFAKSIYQEYRTDVMCEYLHKLIYSHQTTNSFAELIIAQAWRR